MGWFDNEKEAGVVPGTNSPALTHPAQSAAAHTSEPVSSGSSIGVAVHIEGTVEAEEDLTIVGRVTGTIRAKESLIIAKPARIKATIQGCRIHVDGDVTGDLSATDTVVLGANATINGNIKTPTLEIRDGARLTGNVDMGPRQTKAAVKSNVDKSGPEALSGGRSAAKVGSEPPTGKRAHGAATGQTATPGTGETTIISGAGVDAEPVRG